MTPNNLDHPTFHQYTDRQNLNISHQIADEKQSSR